MPEAGDALKTLIQESGIASDGETAKQLHNYLALLQKWNLMINLTSSTEWDAMGPLFQEGIWAAKLYPDGAMHHLDIGSGAGFPAVLIKILKPQIRLDLVESRAKKGVFLETVANTLQLKEMQVHAMRLQTFLEQSGRTSSWDCISWKGLKLSGDDLRMLLAHTSAATQFWMFHGSELAVEEPRLFDQYFRLLRMERFAGRKIWALSMYIAK